MTARAAAAASAVLALSLAGCTPSGAPVHDANALPLAPVHGGLAQECACAGSMATMASRGNQVVLARMLQAGGLLGTELLGSDDGGATFSAVPVDGQPVTAGTLDGVHARKGQWLAYRATSDAVTVLLSDDGRGFTAAGPPIALEGGEAVRAVAGTAEGWSMLVGTGPDTDDQRVLSSPDGMAWTARSADASGLRGTGNVVVADVAGNDSMLLAVGHQEFEPKEDGTEVVAKAFSSTDLGVTWEAVAVPAEPIAPDNAGLQDIAWDGSLFRAFGWGWDVDRYGTGANGLGLRASFEPKRGRWTMALDKRVADGSSNAFDTTEFFAGTPGQVFIGGNASSYTAGAMFQLGAKGKAVEITPPPVVPGERLVPQTVAAVADGFLASFDHVAGGMRQPRLYRVDARGRTTAVELPPPGLSLGTEPRILSSGMDADGVLTGFGYQGRQPVLWSYDPASRSWTAPVSLAVGALDELQGMSASANGIALWGERTTAVGKAEAGLLWSRPAGSTGAFTIIAGEVFGRMNDGERETVRGAAVTSRGTVVVGWRASPGHSSKATLALVDSAGNARQTSPRDLVGSTGEPTGLSAVVQAGKGNIVVLGSPADGKTAVPGAWHSRDGRTWTRAKVQLPAGVKQADFRHARQSGNRLYAVLSPEAPETASEHLYASNDGGKTWTAAAALGAKDTAESLGVTALAARGTDVAVAAGRGAYTGKGTVELLHSSDAGRTFGTLELPDGALLRPHALVEDLALVDGALVVSGMSGDVMDRHPFSVRVELPAPSAAPSSGVR